MADKYIESTVEEISTEKEIKIKYFNENVKLEKIEKGDWIDLRVNEVSINGEKVEWSKNNEIFYYENNFILIHTGIVMQLPENYEAHIAPRGSTFKKFGLIQANSVGVVDESYCGENDQWFIPMICLRKGRVKRYERVAQFRIMEKMPTIHFKETESFTNPDRGSQGSTGYN